MYFYFSKVDMKQIIKKCSSFLLLLSITIIPKISISVELEWSKFVAGDLTDIYVNEKSIKYLKKEEKVYYYSLYDHKFFQNDKKKIKANFSKTLYMEINCKTMMFKVRQQCLYPKPMGKGKPLTSCEPHNTNWQYSPPGNWHYEYHKYICNKMK